MKFIFFKSYLFSCLVHLLHITFYKFLNVFLELIYLLKNFDI